MRRAVQVLGVVGALTVSGISYVNAQAGPRRVVVNMMSAQGQSIGSATIVAKGSGVEILYNFKGLPPGTHAFHIHQTAKCEGPAFTTAGGHFNPEMKKHGLQNPMGPHAGDMNNFVVKADGTAKGSTVDPRVTLNAGANSLLAGGGTALMIHAGPDDMKTDPTGNAGDRIACGVITAP